MIKTFRDERLQDIIDNCDILLACLAPEVQTDSTPAGRMISQLKWLKERAEAGTLTLPVDPAFIASLRYMYTDGSLGYLCSSHEEYLNKIELPLERLMSLTKYGRYLLKPPYYPYAIRYLHKLIAILKNPSRPLSMHEQNSIAELEQIKTQLREGKIEPPVMSWRDYPDFRKVYSMVGSTIDDLPEGEETCRLVADLIFEGERPASWTTPEAADRETRRFVRG